MDFNFRGFDSPRQHYPLFPTSSQSSVSGHAFYSDHPVTDPWPMGKSVVDTKEAIEREIAKELMRLEIIAEEIAQQCLRKDMMMEPDNVTGQPFDVSVSSLKQNLPSSSSSAVERSSELCLDTLNKEMEEWSCSLCQINATSEQGLNDHFAGKKHRSKMEALNGSENVVQNGLRNVQEYVSEQPLETTDSAKCVSADLQKWNCSLCQISTISLQSLNDHFDGKKHQLKMEGLIGSKNDGEIGLRNFKNSVNKQPLETKNSAACVSSDFQEWSCLLCQISASSEKDLNLHLAGKKHRLKMEGLNGSKKDGEIGLTNLKNRVNKQPLETKNSSKCVSSDLQEWRCLLCHVSVTSKQGFYDHLFGKKHRSKMEGLDGVEIDLRNFNKSDNKQPVETKNSAKCVSSNLEEWSCSLCQINVTSKQGLTDHLAGKKHQAKMEGVNGSKNGGENGLKSIKEFDNKQPLEIMNSAKCVSSDLLEWSCSLCQISVTSEQCLNLHLAGKKHKSNMEAYNGNKNGDEVGLRNLMKNVNKHPLETMISAKCVSSGLKKWSCSACQISVTSEQCLNNHLAGKKHQSNIEGLNGNKNGDEIGLGNIKKSVKKQLLETKNSAKCVSSDLQNWSCSLCQVSVTSEQCLNHHLAGKRHQSKMDGVNGSKNSSEIGLRNNKKSGNNKQTQETMKSATRVSFDLKEDQKTVGENTKQKIKSWCRLCQVEAPNEKGMIKHMEGKRHLKNLLIKFECTDSIL